MTDQRIIGQRTPAITVRRNKTIQAIGIEIASFALCQFLRRELSEFETLVALFRRPLLIPKHSGYEVCEGDDIIFFGISQGTNPQVRLDPVKAIGAFRVANSGATGFNGA